MFRRPTVLVVGAGASVEAGLPSGGVLLRRLAEAIKLRFDFNSMTAGDFRIENALRRFCLEKAGSQGAGIDLMNEYVRAGWRVAEAAREGLSIDAIIDQHEDDKVEFMGKLGIAREILKAEQESKLRCPERRVDELNLDGCRDTWLPRFGRLLVEGRKISALAEVFENLTIITFNYDRCIEHYLPFSLVSHYGIPLQQARELVSKLKIYHPFGIVGRLSWLAGSQPVVPFGEANQSDLVAVSAQIRTFTEQMQDVGSLNAMRFAMHQADRIVYLGFAYHRPNLALISPQHPTNAKSILGTVKNISSQDQKVIRAEVGQSLGIDHQLIALLDMTCCQLFDENWRTLTS